MVLALGLRVPVSETFDINSEGFGGGRGGYDDRRGGGYGGERRERKLSDNKEDFREPTAGTQLAGMRIRNLFSSYPVQLKKKNRIRIRP